MSKINNFIDQNKDRFLQELIELLKIPSVSADSKFSENVREAANYIHNKLISAGAENCQIFETKGHPIVYGEKIINDSFPTILVYGHYDVQPADPYDLWDSNPFDPVIKKLLYTPKEQFLLVGHVMTRVKCTCI